MKVVVDNTKEEDLLVRTWIIGENSSGALRLIITSEDSIIGATDFMSRQDIMDYLAVQLNVEIKDLEARQFEDTNPLYLVEDEND